MEVFPAQQPFAPLAVEQQQFLFMEDTFKQFIQVTMGNVQEPNEILQEVRNNGLMNTRAILKLESYWVNWRVKLQIVKNKTNFQVILNRIQKGNIFSLMRLVHLVNRFMLVYTTIQSASQDDNQVQLPNVEEEIQEE